MNKDYNKLFSLLGGRKFVGVLLASLLTFMSVIWTFMLSDNLNAWSFITVVVVSYFTFLAAYAGLQIYQKKVQNNNK